MALEEERASILGNLERVVSRLEVVKDQLFGRNDGFRVSAPREKAAIGSVRRGRRAGRAGRGELKARVLDALSKAGDSGLRVKDLASSLGAKPANIYAWFQNAVKTNPQIKKIGEAHYRLQGAAAQSNASKPAAKANRSSGKQKPGAKGKRGELAARIMEQLQSAGKTGIKVRDVAERIGVNPKNLFIWFATTGKKNKAIQKIGQGEYRLQG